jgi:gamma-glutamyltranspeptidase/glutathione hydrolase
MVTSSNYLASQAGINVLHNGGNAVDAAIAVAATLAVVYPQMTTLGADNFWLIYNAKTKDLRGLNASGRAGGKATIDFYKGKGYSKIPSRGYLSANTVPGAVSGWDAAYQYAKKNMGHSIPWNQLLLAAISYAKNGFPVSPSLAKWEKINVDTTDKENRDLQRFEAFRKTFLKEDRIPFEVGEILKQPELANTLKLIADRGAQAFYRGPIAKAIAADIQAHGGVLTYQDFATNHPDWVEPITVNYRGYQAYNLPPNTQGLASLEILNILNNFEVKALGQDSADRDKYLSDPAFVKIPLDYLLSSQHGKEQAARIDMQHAAVDVKPIPPTKGDTVWFGVVDKEGNAVSVIQSIYWDFGSGIVAGGTGVLLQNRGSYFSLNPTDVNRLEPGKRTFHTLNPAMLFKNGKPYLIYGTMGGEGQPQTQAAIVTRIIDFGMSPQNAINAPRWLYGRTWGTASKGLKIEGRVSQEVIEQLKERGQPVEAVEPFTDLMGHAGAILIDQTTGVKYGASDPRGDGLAAGY